jgi:hypothetical protein
MKAPPRIALELMLKEKKQEEKLRIIDSFAELLIKTKEN